MQSTFSFSILEHNIDSAQLWNEQRALVEKFLELVETDQLGKNLEYQTKGKRTDFGIGVDDSYRLTLFDFRAKKPVSLNVDYTAGSLDHRRKFGGGNGQLIAKAIGLKKASGPLSVLDATAGLGKDAFVLASLGCTIDMYERSPISWVLVADALIRARNSSDTELVSIINRMHHCYGSAFQTDQVCEDKKIQSHDVVYLDPMFPLSNKSAQVKKDMQIFHAIVGDDNDADQLLAPAKAAARHRVVVKRSKAAPFISEEQPQLSFTGKSSRFDVYPIKGFT